MEQRFEIFTTQIARISRSIKRIKSEGMGEYNLKCAHVSCIYYLYKSESPLTAKQLCDICDEDKAAISRAVDFLETEGYVSCDSKQQKRYKSPLALTEKGKFIGEKIEERIVNILKVTSGELTDGELEIFYKGLNTISKNLAAYCEDNKR